MTKVTRYSVVLVLAGLILWGCDSKPADQQTQSNEVEMTEKKLDTAGEESAKPAEVAQERDPLAAPDDVAAPPEDAERTESGLASKVLKAGTGSTHPTATNSVTVHYTGWTTDGKMFDSSVQRGQPATFPLNRVIEGWTEGVQLMVQGEKRRFWIPQDLAYKGQPGPPAGMLVFDVELLEIR